VADGFSVDVVGSPPDDWFVSNQTPDAGTSAPPGSVVRIESVEDDPCANP
jgi:hypothetical protein